MCQYCIYPVHDRYSITSKCGIKNVNNPPGAIPNLLSPALAQETSVETIARWSGLFLRANVLNDQGARDYVFFSGNALDTNVTVKSQPVPESSATVGLFVVGAIGAASWWKRQKAS